MLEQLILGTIQGIIEWLPVSSEGVLTLVRVEFFDDSASLENAIRVALFLHMGTFLSALVYFRKEVWHLTKSLFHFKKADQKTKSTIRFLVGGTLITGIVGGAIFQGVNIAEEMLDLTGSYIMLFVGIALLITALLQFIAKNKGVRSEENITTGDWIFTGIAQGFSILPGISRSGITTSALLLRKVNDVTSLRLSFLMSLPVVLAGNIVLNISEFTLTLLVLAGLGAAFLFGLLTIHGLLKLAKNINFAYFVLFFAILTIGAAFV